MCMSEFHTRERIKPTSGSKMDQEVKLIIQCV